MVIEFFTRKDEGNGSERNIAGSEEDSPLKSSESTEHDRNLTRPTPQMNEVANPAPGSQFSIPQLFEISSSIRRRRYGFASTILSVSPDTE